MSAYTTRSIWNAIERARTGGERAHDAVCALEWERVRQISMCWHREGWSGSILLAPGALLVHIDDPQYTERPSGHDLAPWCRVVRLMDDTGRMIVRRRAYEVVIAELRQTARCVQVLLVGDRESVIEGGDPPIISMIPAEKLRPCEPAWVPEAAVLP